MCGRLSRLGLVALVSLMGTASALAQQLKGTASDTESSPAAPAPLASPSDAAAVPNFPDVRPPGMAPTPSSPTLSAPPAASSIGGLPDTANSTKFYTITASLREEYDDNIYTTKDNKTGSAVTEFSPSILVSFPMADSSFSGRYTFGLDYYENRRGDQNDYTHEVLLRYTHQFSNRFTLELRDQGGYFTEPDLLNSVGTPFRNGAYFTNTFTADFEAQWTPLLGTSTSYSNVAILYQDDEIGNIQNYDENTISHDFRFAVFPKYNFTAGFIVDDLDYFEVNRGYTNYTLDVGLDWQALPNLSVAVRGGGSLTEEDQLGSSVSPYGSASLDWRLGKRSDLTLNYVHTIEPTDVFDAVGQESDRFTVQFRYDITARITAHLSSTFTYADYTSQVLQSGNSFTEQDLGLDAGLDYRINANFSIEGGYDLGVISSDESERDYTRNRVYLGVRGTY